MRAALGLDLRRALHPTRLLTPSHAGPSAGTNPPGTIDDLAFVVTGAGAATFAWSQAAYASSHEYRKNAGASVAITGNSGSVALTGLVEGDVIEVRGIGPGGNGAWSNAVTFDETAPTLTGAGTALDDAQTIVLSFNEELDEDYSAGPADFTVIAGGITEPVQQVDVITRSASLKLAAGTISFGEVITVSYTQGGAALRDLAGNKVAAFTGQAVTNNVKPAAPAAMAAPTFGTTTSSSFVVNRAAAPADNGTAITRYDLRYATDAAFTAPTTVFSIGASQTVSGRASSTTYYVQTRAYNGTPGPWGTAASVATLAANTAPIVVASPYAASTRTHTFTTDEAGTAHVAGVAAGSTPLNSQVVAGTGGGVLEKVSFAVTTAASTGTMAFTNQSITELHTVVVDSGSLASNVAIATGVTVDSTAPTFVSGTPADGATGVAVDTSMTLTFSEGLVAATGNFYVYAGTTLLETFNIATGTGSAGGLITISGPSVTITRTVDFANSAAVNVRWDAGVVTDTYGNGVAANTTQTLFNFTTVAAGGAPVATYLASGTNSDRFVTDDTIYLPTGTLTSLPAGTRLLVMCSISGAAGANAVGLWMGTLQGILQASAVTTSTGADASMSAWIVDAPSGFGDDGILMWTEGRQIDDLAYDIYRITGLSTVSGAGDDEVGNDSTATSVTLTTTSQAGDTIVAGMVRNINDTTAMAISSGATAAIEEAWDGSSRSRISGLNTAAGANQAVTFAKSGSQDHAALAVVLR